RPTADSADNNANCVAENRCWHSPISSATNDAVPRPPQRFSTPIAVAINQRLFGLTAITQYPRLEIACKRPNAINERYNPQRAINDPPANAPTIVASSPSTLFTDPTSV